MFTSDFEHDKKNFNNIKITLKYAFDPKKIRLMAGFKV